MSLEKGAGNILEGRQDHPLTMPKKRLLQGGRIMTIVFAVAEAAPFIKTGGLGDVAGSLPAALHRQGADVRVIMPKYSSISENFRKEFKSIIHFQVPVAWRNQYCGLEEMVYQGVPYYFLDNEYYFKRTGVYDEFDKAEQFAFFSRAVLESLQYLPHCQTAILHCHDWHTALIPLMLKEFYRNSPIHKQIKTIFTIHNLKYQGIFDKEVLEDIIGLGKEYFTPDTLEFNGAINFMKAGLLYADRVTTVSSTYAQEIKSPFFGEHLEGLLQKRSDNLIGIVNGLDYELFNPDEDPFIKYPFSTSPQAKQMNKMYLQNQLSLPVNNQVPILAMVTRLVDQKGLDLLAHVFEEILALDVQYVVLGTGEPQYEEMLRNFAQKYPQKVIAQLGFDDELAHHIYAGADILLMPSRFEPCGISQMMAMRYGTIPIVRNTGGLADTVISFEKDPERGNGFHFDNYNAHDFLYVIQRAVKLFQEDQKTWGRIKKNALQTNFSWNHSAQEYLKLYKELS
jgi:starch synthase